MSQDDWPYWLGMFIALVAGHVLASKRDNRKLESDANTKLSEEVVKISQRVTVLESNAMTKDDVVDVMERNIMPQLNGIAKRIPEEQNVRAIVVDTMRGYDGRLQSMSEEMHSIKGILSSLQLMLARMGYERKDNRDD